MSYEDYDTPYDPYSCQADYDTHTGDPKQDLAYERQYEQQTYQVIPEVIKNFIQYFHKTVSDLIDQKVYELQASRVSNDVIDQKVYEIQDTVSMRTGKEVLQHGGSYDSVISFLQLLLS
ncbi:eukaryotic translation initiation factor 3 subunit L-like [Phyllobates terribilis]|uniref:eukaryotic translation initiation factor 3 subunit L-like n=1 Tax=Phyllobates terribilis TaxID=111132 RepID=UPI003CCB4D14